MSTALRITAPAAADPSPDRVDSRACLAGGGGEERTARHLAILAELAEIGMDLARLVREAAAGRDIAGNGGAEAADAVARLGGGDPALAFSRIARAVRQTLALETQLADESRDRKRKETTLEGMRQAEAARQAAAAEAARVELRAHEVGGIFIRLISEIEENDEAWLDLDERLADENELAELAQYSVGEMILRLSRRLGISPDWSRWAEEYWAEELRAAEIKLGGVAGAKRPPAARPKSPATSPSVASAPAASPPAAKPSAASPPATSPPANSATRHPALEFLDWLPDGSPSGVEPETVPDIALGPGPPAAPA